MDILLNIGVVILTSLVIWYTGDKFSEASSKIGDYFHISRAVKGATLDAISSSLPEFMVALFAVLSFHKFEVGVGTIAGSALFNLLVIPGLCVLVAKKRFTISKEVVSRDGTFYIISVITLLGVLLYFKNWTILVPLGMILIYFWYLFYVAKHTKKHQSTKTQKKKTKEISLGKELGIGVIMIVLIGVATYFLTEHAILFAEAMGISPIIIGFTIIAAATSLPDTVISVASARKGDVDAAVSNVFGSNIFDILIGLSVPALIAILVFKAPIEIIFTNLEIIFGLLVATVIVLLYLAEEHTLNKKQGIKMLIFYGLFIAYIVYLSLI
jgi:cation:H+ antiporter